METPIPEPVNPLPVNPSPIKPSPAMGVQTVCPKCHHGFWHKVGDVVKDVVEIPVTIIADNSNMGGAGE